MCSCIALIHMCGCIALIHMCGYNPHVWPCSCIAITKDCGIVGPPQLDHFSGKASSTLHAPDLDKQQLSSCIVLKLPCPRLNYVYCDKEYES